MAAAGALQTAATAITVVQLAFDTYHFIKEVVNAGVEARLLCQKTYRLYRLVKAVEARVHIREQLRGSHRIPPGEAEIEDVVCENLAAVQKGLFSINRRLRGLTDDAPLDLTTKAIRHLRFTLSSATIHRLERATETNIQTLSTALHLLQLLEHAGTQKRIDRLEKSVNRAVAHLKSLTPMSASTLPLPPYTPTAMDFAGTSAEPDVDQLGIKVLERTIKVANTVRSTYGSMSEPDKASLAAMDAVLSSDESDIGSDDEELDAVIPKLLEPNQRTTTTQPDPDDTSPAAIYGTIGMGRYPSKMLSKEKQKFQEHAAREFAKGNYSTTEEHLRNAFERGIILEDRGYEVFVNKRELQQRLSDIYMKQCKYAEAVKELHGLIQGLDQSETPELILERALLNKTLAQVHHSRYLSNKERGNRDRADENIHLAEIYAIEQSFTGLEELLKAGNCVITRRCSDFVETVQLIIRILEDQGKTIQAEAWREEYLGESSHPTSQTGVDPDWEHVLPNELETPGRPRLINAIVFDLREDFQTVLAELIEIGGDIDERCEEDLTPIMHAAACKHVSGCGCEKAIEKLVYHEADINATTGPHNETALHQAAAAGNEQMVGLLISKEADKDASAPHTPLLVAVKNNQALIADILLEQGADPNLLSPDRWSMLHHAVNSNAFDVLLTLLSSKHKDKINIEAKSSSGGTALLFAAERASKPQSHALAEALLRKNADANATDSFGRSALYFATNGPRNDERESLVRLLLRYGADPSLTPPRFRSRFGEYIALRQGNADLRRRDGSISSESSGRDRSHRTSFGAGDSNVSRRDSATTVSSVMSGGTQLTENMSVSPRSGLFGWKLGRKNTNK